MAPTTSSSAGTIQSTQQVHEGTLAGSGRSDDSNPFAGPHLQIDASQHLERPLGGHKPLDQTVDRNHGSACASNVVRFTSHNLTPHRYS